MKKFLIILILSSLVASCGHKAESSKSKFKIFSGNLINGVTIFTGGLLITGRSLDGQQSFRTTYQPNLELDLKKGSWEFATIGWMGANPMEGNQQCAYQRVEINSDTFTVNFNMNYQNCLTQSTVDGSLFSDPIFYNSIGGTYNGFKKLQVQTCADLDNCGNQTVAHSYKVEIPSEFKGITSNVGSGASLISQCISGNGISNITPPHGGSKGFIGLKLTTFGNNAARFSTTRGMAFDSFGNMFVTDFFNNTIRKITPSGVVTTLAGVAGTYGTADGLGSVARFNYPYGIAIDSLNNIYVTDQGNHTIRKITPAGLVSTFAGTATISGNDGGIGSSARFKEPTGIALDSSDNIFVSEYSNHTIRKITPAGLVTTFAGLAGTIGSVDGSGSSARFYTPYGLAIDSMDNIFVADLDNSIIRKITSAGVVTTLAGLPGSWSNADGTGTAARFYQPPGIVVDSFGDLYVTDLGNRTIRKVTSSGIVTTIAGLPGSIGTANGTGSTARFSAPWGLTIDSSDNIYVNDDSRIRKVTPAGVVTTFAGTNANGSQDGPALVENCSGVTKNYSFNHGFGEVLNQTFADAGNLVIRRGALSVDIASPDASLALTPVSFHGDYSIPDTLPSLIGINDLYVYKGITMTSIPYANPGDYLYYDGLDWIKFPETDSVKLLLQSP